MNCRNVMPFSADSYEFRANNLRITSSFHNHNHSYNHNHNHSRLLLAIRRMHRRAVHLTLHNNHLNNHVSSTNIQRTNSQSSVLQHRRF